MGSDPDFRSPLYDRGLMCRLDPVWALPLGPQGTGLGSGNGVGVVVPRTWVDWPSRSPTPSGPSPSTTISERRTSTETGSRALYLDSGRWHGKTYRASLTTAMSRARATRAAEERSSRRNLAA